MINYIPAFLALYGDAGCWLTDISVIQNVCKNETRVTFQAPPGFDKNFTEFIAYYGAASILEQDHTEKTIAPAVNLFS